MKKIEPNKQTHKQQKKDLDQKINMFDRLPEKCLTCFSPFDRKNKEQVQSWFVVVKNKDQKVHLYCPDCWNKAQALMQKVVDDFKTRKEQQEDEQHT